MGDEPLITWCWLCRALSRWPLRNVRERHMGKRHPITLMTSDGPGGQA